RTRVSQSYSSSRAAPHKRRLNLADLVRRSPHCDDG
ncbi:hypothetical protein NFI96_012173, partial [Prochilodus magdalenae]